MTSDLYTHHHRTEVNVAVDTSKLFACLDDHRRLAGHMEKPSLMMAGATMQVGMDALKGQAVGSVIRITGRVLGLNLAVDEVVTERVPPLRKTWETRGEPRLLVIGSYRIGWGSPSLPCRMARGWWCSSITSFRCTACRDYSRCCLVGPMLPGALGA